MIWGFNYKYLPHVVAIKAMNKVASHINEMQKLHEEYGAVFDQLINEQTADKKEVEHINVSALSPVNDPVTYLLFLLTCCCFFTLCITGGWPLDGGSFTTFYSGMDKPSNLFGQEQKGPGFSCFWYGFM